MHRPIHILLVDDHRLFREGVAHSLAATDDFVVVGEAGSGEEALSLAAALQPDMVLLDVSMPGMGGIAAAEKLSVSLPGVRIMMLTVAEDPECLLAALKNGAHGYVLKGVSAAELRRIAASVADGEAYVTPALAAELLVEFSRARPQDALSSLTPRESGVLELLSRGLTNREIGEHLHLAEKTVKHHMTSILQKLHVRSRTEAVALALRNKAFG
ncbi:response regulator transcription factor [Thauera sp.]|jgi:DNA-binding NarL/FixJ family response regulator|uniref:response regulator transcription factor n=1 Tax=Thauera sp. TaxID=1905334 RepID=UPI002A36261F|nr:response regulator transcription factor [Thauera sp.]MDX9884695.1 response regulator transcription factor [Thauera sp.]